MIPGEDGDINKFRGGSKFTLNKDCISCTDNMSTHMNLFKIACVNYQSNPIVYQSKLLPRQELISL